MAKLYTTPYHHTSWSPPWAYSCIYTHAEDSCAVVYEVIITPAQLLILLHKPLQPYHDFLQGERRRIQIGWQCRRRIIKFWIWMGEFCICNKPGARRTRYPPTPPHANRHAVTAESAAEQKYSTLRVRWMSVGVWWQGDGWTIPDGK